MKNFIISLLGILLLCAIGVAGYFAHKQLTATEPPSEKVSYKEPTFAVPSEAVTYHRNLEVKDYYNTVFMEMDASIVEEVAYVLLSKSSRITKEEIVDEYLDNRITYDALYKRRCEGQNANQQIISADDNNNNEKITNHPRDSMKQNNDSTSVKTITTNTK